MSEYITLDKEKLIELLEKAFDEGWDSCRDMKESACLHIVEEFVEKNPTSSSNNNNGSPPISDFVDIAGTTFNMENVTINNNVHQHGYTVGPDYNPPWTVEQYNNWDNNNLLIQNSVLTGAAELINADRNGYIITTNENNIH